MAARLVFSISSKKFDDFVIYFWQNHITSRSNVPLSNRFKAFMSSDGVFRDLYFHIVWVLCRKEEGQSVSSVEYWFESFLKRNFFQSTRETVVKVLKILKNVSHFLESVEIRSCMLKKRKEGLIFE